MRLAGLVGITVTGLVHFFLLRPLLDLDGADWVADKLLHMVVPVARRRGLGVGRTPPADHLRARWRTHSAWPLAWLVWTLVFGRDRRLGAVPVPGRRRGGLGRRSAVVCVGITALFVALFALAAWLDRKLPPAPR